MSAPTPRSLADSGYVGADPGSSGAIAYVQGGRVSVWDMPLRSKPVGGVIVDDMGLISITNALASLEPAASFLELTWGVKGQGGATQYKFGDSAGALRMAMAAAGLAPELVSSQRWTAVLRCGNDKLRHVEMAKQLFPQDIELFTPKRGVLTLEACKGRADATLIAVYARKLAGG